MVSSEFAQRLCCPALTGTGLGRQFGKLNAAAGSIAMCIALESLFAGAGGIMPKENEIDGGGVVV